MSYQEISRRVGAVMTTNTILELGAARRIEIGEIVEQADEWDDLPQDVQLIVEAAEAEAAAATA